MANHKHDNENPEYSHHHKISDARGGSSELPNNELIKHKTHNAIHRLFQNEYTLEKIETIINMDEAILTDYFKRAIMDVLNMDYKDVVIREAFASKTDYRDFPETRAHNNFGSKRNKNRRF